jgi:hypothetical protein
MELPAEYQLVASIIVGVVIIGGALLKYLRDMRRGNDDPPVAGLAKEIGDFRRLIERIDERDRSGELADRIRELIGAIDNHRRQTEDLRRSIEGVTSALIRKA